MGRFCVWMREAAQRRPGTAPSHTVGFYLHSGGQVLSGVGLEGAWLAGPRKVDHVFADPSKTADRS